MKKLITLLCSLVPALGFSQDTLLYENFNVDPTANYLLVSNGNDTTWVDFDVDNLANGSSDIRPGNWFWSAAGFATADSTGCLFSNSWFTSPGKALNYLITPPLYIGNGNGVLSWKSAPRQTPKYVDGYKVLVSTTGNDPSNANTFTDTLYAAGEYLSDVVGTGTDTTFSNFTFSNGFIHGADGTYIEYDGDSLRFIGEFRPFTASLAAYSGQTIYIAFLHDAFDDNLISVDDILVSGIGLTGINQHASEGNKMIVSPNPSSDQVKVNYYLPGTARITIRVYDEKGGLVRSNEEGIQIAGEQQIILNVRDLASGKYTLQVIAGNKYTKTSFMVAR